MTNRYYIPKKWLQFKVYLGEDGKFYVRYSKIGHNKEALKMFRKSKEIIEVQPKEAF